MGRACGPWVGWAASPIDVKRLTRTPASYSTHTQGHHSSHTTSDRVESILCEIRDSDVVMLYVGRIASYVRMGNTVLMVLVYTIPDVRGPRG